jgi:protein-disulfide isomerase
MTHGGTGREHLSKNERRLAARDKATALRLQQKKKDRFRRFFLQGGLIIGSLAVVAVVVLVIVNTVRPAGPGPLNMLSDGIKIGQDFKAVPTAALQADAEPVPSESNTDNVIDIQLYVDYLCPYCQQFGETNDAQIESWMARGAATIEIHPISILNPNSQGTKYSTRAANAAACVANYAPDSYWAVNKALFAAQPEERTPGLSDEELTKVVTGVEGLTNASSISTCITDQTFKGWVGESTLRALDGTIPGTDATVEGTPTVIVDGLKYDGAIDDADAFAAIVVSAAGASFTESSTATPTPTPTPVAP